MKVIFWRKIYEIESQEAIQHYFKYSSKQFQLMFPGKNLSLKKWG